VLDGDRRVLGVVTRKEALSANEESAMQPLLSISRREPIAAWTDEPLRAVVYRMVESGFTRMPVLDRQTGRLAGMISLQDMLGARTRSLSEEAKRERVLRLRFPFGRTESEVVTDTVR
jgi:CBS-domain-containing membrane protein